MVTATLSRGGTSVDIELWEEAGNLLIARDVGKPNARIQEVSREDPRSADHLSALDQFTLVGRVPSYTAAQTLAESLIKPHSDGTDLTLDLTAVPGFSSTFTVGVPSARACELDYRPGVREIVDVQLSLPVVSDTIG